MLIELADNLLDERWSDVEIEALDTILKARRLGYHLLLGSNNLFRNLESISEFSRISQRIIGKVRRRQVQKAGLRRAVTHIIRISRDDEQRIQNVDGTRVMNIKLSHFRDTRTAEGTTILGEHHDDAELYKRMGEWYAVFMKLSGVKLDCRTALGGGTTTAKVFRGFRDECRLCICVVDADSNAPDAKIGVTARAVLKECDEDKPWAQVVVTSCREAENTLPARVVEMAVERTPESLRLVPEYLEQLDGEALPADTGDYCDFKKGTQAEMGI